MTTNNAFKAESPCPALEDRDVAKDIKIASRWIADIEAQERCRHFFDRNGICTKCDVDRAFLRPKLTEEQHLDSYWDDPLRGTNKA